MLIRPDHLGDLLLTSPAVELLRKGLPDAHLTMLVGPWAADVARRDPLLDEVRVLSFPGFTRKAKGSPVAPYALLYREAAILKRARFDAALILRFDHWWGAWLAAQAGIPIRVGFGVKECRPFLTHSLLPPVVVHWSEQSLEVVRRLLRLGSRALPVQSSDPLLLRFGLRPEDETSGERLLEELNLDRSRPTVAFHPGSGSPLKSWPEDRWIVLGRALSGRGAQLLVTGSGGEVATADRIAAAVPGARSLAGKTDVGTLAAVYRRCGLVVGTDNGPLHLAVALDVPSLRLYGPTDPAVFGPWGDPERHRAILADWPGAPCGRLDLHTPDGSPPPCMRAIGVETVLLECQELLGTR
ncbi:MAG TPA: glycosyltransferase family 9 protein [Chloroflexota bacterium]|nr:glycosyltransferase family 9 protein [Chloroflexota bacterium]